MSETSAQPSFFGKFLKGAMSGAFSGALMMGVVALVAATGLTGLTFMGPAAAAGMVVCTALFGGIMSALRSGESRGSAPEVTAAEAITPVISQSVGHAPSISMDAAEDMAPTRADGKSWAETAGRAQGASANIDSILANGAMSDKTRAEAILASRSNGAEPSLG